jgi:hypothetical protein
MVTNQQKMTVLLIAAGLLVTAVIAPLHIQQAFARHVHITIYGHGSVEMSGHGHAPDVTLDCEPSSGGFGFGWHLRAEC